MPKRSTKMMNGQAGSSPSVNKQPPRWLIIGNPENRRVGLFQQALHALGQLPAEVLAYRELLQNRSLLPVVLAQASQHRSIVRIESPGEHSLVEKLLIQRGQSQVGSTSDPTVKVLRIRDDPGRVRYPRLWFDGFSSLLKEIAAALNHQPGVRVQSHPTAIQTLFDKRACHRLLQSAGVSVPRVLPPVRSYDELREAMQAQGMKRVFVKLASGSASSGVVALSTVNARPLAITSLELARRRGEARFYNNLKLSRYTRDQDLRVICDFLCREGAHVEEWLPKAQQAGRSFDLRVVTIGGKAGHTVVRTSRSPITNLHLGNRRGDWSSLKRAMGRHWKIVPETCERAAQAFPQMLTVGWDLLVAPGFRRAYVLEGNAFGDLLPNVLFKGEPTYAATIRAAGQLLK
ncbi:STM4014 family protein [Anatilimnocola sp. NA78]|uniref:STM4014 family protein n=1 Tax=Anatilimnocola sp. NA78 TaxID=3415683 RepID=UPI003CE563D0